MQSVFEQFIQDFEKKFSIRVSDYDSSCQETTIIINSSDSTLEAINLWVNEDNVKNILSQYSRPIMFVVDKHNVYLAYSLCLVAYLGIKAFFAKKLLQ